MGEIFRRETAEHPEPFTGERLTAAVSGQIQIEHYHRYLFARSFAFGLDVLDVASGEGYGSALLAQVARSVVGVEYSGQTANTASTNFPRKNLRFLQGDARALPLADGCVDLVVSFETIEHFDRQDAFLREVRRVLRPGGRFIVSTPDRDVYSPLGSGANPYHVHELTCDEFLAALRQTFGHVSSVRQRVLTGSALLSDTGSDGVPLVFDRRGDSHFEACTGMPRAPYVLAVASDEELPPLPPSLYIDRSDIETDKIRAIGLEARVRELGAVIAERDARQAEFSAHLVSLDAHVLERNVRLQERDLRIAELDALIAELRVQLDRLRKKEGAVNAEIALLKTELGRVNEQAIHLQPVCARADALQKKLDYVRGSFRGFMRGYLPRLYRHLRGG
jgi:SAM-dependent methyltransferase